MKKAEDDELLISIFQQINAFLEDRCVSLGTSYAPPDIQTFHASLVGKHIQLLLAWNHRERPIPYPSVEESIKVLQHLFCTTPLGAFCRPTDFHKTPLGSLMNDARLGFTGLSDTLNPTQAARKIGVSRQTIYDWISQGKLDPIWVNDRPLVTLFQLMSAQVKDRKAKKAEGQTHDH